MRLIIKGFFEEQSTFWKIKIPKRLLVPFMTVLAAKVAGAVFVYYFLNVQNSGTFWMDANRVFPWVQNAVFLENANRGVNWAYSFVGWDSAWYLSIMTRGYGFSPQSYVFSPGLPFFSAVFSLLFQNPVASMAICAAVFGILWVPLYQLVAEKYMSKQAALASALLFALSPYTFLFTTVAYSEGMFLFFTLGAWYLFKKGNKVSSSVFAAASFFSRIMVGVVLILPMLYESLREKGSRRIRNVALSLAPAFALVSWLIYFKVTADDFFPFSHATEWGSLYTFRTLLFDGLPKLGLGVFEDALQNNSTPPHWLAPIAVVAALIIPPFLIYRAAKTEKSLALYSLAYYVGILLFGALASTPRYISVLFPLWIMLTAKLSLSGKSKVLVAVISAVFLVVSLSMWIDFLNGQFVA